MSVSRRDLMVRGSSLAVVLHGPAHGDYAAKSVSIDSFSSYLGQPWTVPRGTRVVIDILNGSPERSLIRVLDAIQDWDIPAAALVILQVADGKHIQRQTLSISHAHGKRIQILGNLQNPDACELHWEAPKADALFVGSSCVLGLIDGITLSRSSHGSNDNGATDNACGLLASDGGVIMCGSRIAVREFYYGFHARRGGLIRANGTSVSNGGDAGYFAYLGGHISAHGARASRCSDRQLDLGSGFVAEYGGTIDATESLSNGNALAGYSALSAGSIIANRSRAETNDKYGYFATTNGVIVAHEWTAKQNGRAPFNESEGGRISGRPLAK